MSLEIIFVHDQGDHDTEHVLLKARANCRLSDFLLADGRHPDEAPAPDRIRHTYWFPETRIQAGTYISVWTKRGKDTLGEMADGTPVHRFYWNRPESVWNGVGEHVLLFQIAKCQSFRVHEN